MKALGVPHVCLDEIYEKSRSYRTLYKNLAAAVAGFGDGTAYCVDGSAGEDNSVKELSKKRGVKLSVIEGVSKVSAAVDAAGFSGCSYQAVSAYELAETRLTAPLVVYDMPDREIAGDVKLALMDRFGDEKEVLYICGGRSKRIPLYELDRQEEYDGTSASRWKSRNCSTKRGSTSPISKRSSSGSAVRTAARGTRCRPPKASG